MTPRFDRRPPCVVLIALTSATLSCAGSGHQGGGAAATGGSSSSGGAGVGGFIGTGGAGGASARPFTDGSRLKAAYDEVAGAPPRFVSWYDTELGVSCAFASYASGTACIPRGANSATWSYVFADAGCTQPLVENVGSENVGSDPVVTVYETACVPPRIFSTGVPFAADAPAYFGDGKMCISLGPLGPSFIRLGPEIPFDRLVSGTTHVEAGSSRILPMTLVGSDGSSQEFWQAWDASRGEIVSSTAFNQDRWYPPSIPRIQSLFVDCAATMPAVEAICAVVPPKEAVRVTDTSCGPATLDFFSTGDALDPSVYYYAIGCVEYARAADQLILKVGAPFAASDFAAVTTDYVGTGPVKLAEDGTDHGPGAQIGRFFDTAHDTVCDAGVAADGVVRCLPFPSPYALSVDFSDPACTQPLALVHTSGAAIHKPTILSVPTFSSPPKYRYFPILDAHSGDVYAPASDGACARITPSTSQSFYALGPEIAATDLAPMQMVRPGP